MNLRAIIGEDELVARECLRAMAEADGIQVVAECSDGKQTLSALHCYRPDLLFLDVEMPLLDGFGVLGSLDPETLPAVIFTTAHDQYAVRAFDCDAVDYLLKPFEEERFRKATKRARLFLSSRTAAKDLTDRLLKALQRGGPHASNQRVAIRSRGQTTFLLMDEIDWIEAAGNYVRIRAGHDVHLLRQTISAMEAQLDSNQFLRIHRCLIVNIDRIRKTEACGYGEYLVVLNDGKKLSLGASYRERFDRLVDKTLLAGGSLPQPDLIPAPKRR